MVATQHKHKHRMIKTRNKYKGSGIKKMLSNYFFPKKNPPVLTREEPVLTREEPVLTEEEPVLTEKEKEEEKNDLEEWGKASQLLKNKYHNEKKQQEREEKEELKKQEREEQVREEKEKEELELKKLVEGIEATLDAVTNGVKVRTIENEIYYADESHFANEIKKVVDINSRLVKQSGDLKVHAIRIGGELLKTENTILDILSLSKKEDETKFMEKTAKIRGDIIRELDNFADSQNKFLEELFLNVRTNHQIDIRDEKLIKLQNKARYSSKSLMTTLINVEKYLLKLNHYIQTVNQQKRITSTNGGKSKKRKNRRTRRIKRH